MERHLEELDKKELRMSGWTMEPRENVTNDYVIGLLKRYMVDLEDRMLIHDKNESGIAMTLRKVTGLDVS